MINTIEDEISERFDVDDIRKIRDFNASRHVNMSATEIVDEIRNNTDEIISLYGLKRPVSGVRTRGV